MKTAMIVAMADNRVIGQDGAMPWHLPADLKYFKRVTMGAPVIMGRKTFQSIGRPLPGRVNIVITRDPDFRPAGTEVVHSLDEALARAAEIARDDGRDEIFVIGGGQIYAQALAHADRLYVTEIHRTCDGDAVFPAITETDWIESRREAHPPETEGGPAFSFVVWERRC